MSTRVLSNYWPKFNETSMESEAAKENAHVTHVLWSDDFSQSYITLSIATLFFLPICLGKHYCMMIRDIRFKLHSYIGYDDASNEFPFQVDRVEVKVTVGIFRNILSSD